MISTLSARALAIVLVMHAVLGNNDVGSCHVAGCGARGKNAASGYALMQQVQQQNQDHITKVVAKEAQGAVDSTTQTAAESSSVADKEAHGAADSRAQIVATSSSITERKPKTPLRSMRKTAALRQSLKSRGSAVSKPMKYDKLALIQSMSATSSTQRLGMARLAANLHPPSHKRVHGRTAPLDEAGYQAVAALRSDDDTDMFIRRVIDAYDCKIVRQAGLGSIVPWFSGRKAVQSFEKLQETLLYAVLTNKPNPWLSYRNSDGTTGDNAELNAMGYVEVAATRNQRDVAKFARRVCKKLGVDIVDEDGFQRMVKSYSGADNFHDYAQLMRAIVDAADAAHTWALRKQPDKEQPDKGVDYKQKWVIDVTKNT